MVSFKNINLEQYDENVGIGKLLDEKAPRIQRKVFTTCKKYLIHIQRSVFEGGITKLKLMELKKYIRKDEDSVIIFKSRDEKWLQKEFIGKVDDATSRFF